MPKLSIRLAILDDGDDIINAMQCSRELHYPWIEAPCDKPSFLSYFQQYKAQDNGFCYLIRVDNQLAGIINVSNIVRGTFQSAFLGYMAVQGYNGQGYMTQGLKLVLHQAFTSLKLHRLEANIQVDNTQSIALVTRCGFRLEGVSPHYLHIDHKWRQHQRYALTIEDWQIQSRQ